MKKSKKNIKSLSKSINNDSKIENMPIEAPSQQPDTENVEPDLKDAEHIAISTLKATHEALMELSIRRLDLKLSNSRVAGVARELKELMKVMSVYEAV